jgi:4-amino-4-deoxy-L-arabinose transferase-like glycosyltransferase
MFGIRSPAPGHSEPQWVRISLCLILLVAGISYTWSIQRAPLFGYYATAVRTMSSDWRLFFFGGFDSSGWLTVDKLPGAFWIQAIVVRIFGFSSWTLIGPQVVEGLITIVITFRLVRRYSGAAGALVGASVVAVMPVFTAVSRGNVSDTLSTLLVMLAAHATLQAVSLNQFRSLALAAMWVAAAFQAKMIQAWLVLPVMAAVYLLAAHPRLITRLLHVAVATLISVVGSLLWMIAVSMVPGSARPWFDGSPHNSVFEQVFVYNALGRLQDDTSFGIARVNVHAGAGPVGLRFSSDQLHITTLRVQNVASIQYSRLFYGPFALGVGWLLPLALVSGLVALWSRRREPRTDLLRAATVMWLLWIIGHVIVFSILHHVNNYYTAVLVAPVGALIGSATYLMSRAVFDGRRSGRWWSSAALGGNALYAAILLGSAGPQWFYVRLPALALCAATIAVILFRRSHALITLLGLASLLIVPAIGSVALDSHDGGPYTFAFSQSGIAADQHVANQSLEARYRAPLSDILAYIEPRDGPYKYLVATGGATQAANFNLATGRSILPIGGYTGLIPTPSLPDIISLITQRQLRFAYIDPTASDPRMQWIAHTCVPIRPHLFGTFPRPQSSQLYDCQPAPGRII